MPSETSTPYVKSLDDELSFKLIDQLHAAVLQISNFCFEIKKFCVTTQFVVLTLIIKFTGDKLDTALFVTCLAIPLAFWFLDAVAYFYQVKLRGKIDVVIDEIKSRNRAHVLLADARRVDVIEADRVDGSQVERVTEAFFNHSMWIYGLLIFVDLIAWALYSSGVIR